MRRAAKFNTKKYKNLRENRFPISQERFVNNEVLNVILNFFKNSCSVEIFLAALKNG